MTTPLPAALNAPYSQEAEEATLGSVLVNPASFLELAAFLHADHFFLLRHTRIWQAMTRLSDRQEPIDYGTVAGELKNLGVFDEVGGHAYLMQLINNTPTSVHGWIYAQTVQRVAMRRRVLEFADRARELALDESRPYDDIYLELQSGLDGLQIEDRQRFVRGSTSSETYNDLLSELMLRFERGELTGFPLPEAWRSLTDALPALFPGQLTVISGSTGAGKSAMLETLAEHYAGIGLKVAYIHTEMSTADMLHRRMARHSGLAYQRLAMGDVPPAAEDRVMAAREHIDTWSHRLNYLWLPDVDFRRLALEMRLAASSGTQVIFIDHFQDVTFPGEDNPVRAYEKAVVWLNAFAEKRNVLVVVASQLNDAGKVKWARKLAEKAVVHLSIRREVLTGEYIYSYRDIDYLSLPGMFSPVTQVAVVKARFGQMRKTTLIYHGAGFTYLDRSQLQGAAVRNIVPFKERQQANRHWAQGED